MRGGESTVDDFFQTPRYNPLNMQNPHTLNPLTLGRRSARRSPAEGISQSAGGRPGMAARRSRAERVAGAGALPDWCCGSSRARTVRLGSARVSRSHTADSARGSRPARPATMQFLQRSHHPTINITVLAGLHRPITKGAINSCSTDISPVLSDSESFRLHSHQGLPVRGTQANISPLSVITTHLELHSSATTHFLQRTHEQRSARYK